VGPVGRSEPRRLATIQERKREMSEPLMSGCSRRLTSRVGCTIRGGQLTSLLGGGTQIVFHPGRSDCSIQHRELQRQRR
jgi:hypothetical protein